MHGIRPASEDRLRTCLVAVDVQITFCIPGFELYVGGRSGTGAIDDNRRLCSFLYRNLQRITQIVPTMDTHRAMQIFHSIALVDERGKPPAAYTLVTEDDVLNGRWRYNPAISDSMGMSPDQGQRHLEHYTRMLRRSGKYDLMAWPYHAMLGGIGHALVPAVEQAIFFHTVARFSQPEFHIKGDRPLTEHYSALGPEVDTGPDGEMLHEPDDFFNTVLEQYDAVIVAGQAKSHCVAWTIADLMEKVLERDRSHVEKVYLLEDCTSPVVVPGSIDYTDAADAAFQRFSDAGMHVVRSVDPMTSWPGLEQYAD
jgi:nicotinamidase-related amidase